MRHQDASACALLVLSTSGLASLASAQAPPASPLVERRAHSIPWPSLQPGAFGRAAAGDVTGDLVPDAVVLANGTPVLFSGPAQYGGSLAVPTTASDVAVLHVAGGPALCIASGTSGLEAWTFDDATSTAVLLDAESSLAAARALCPADVDGDGSDELLVLAADGRSVAVVAVAASQIDAWYSVDLPAGSEPAVALGAVEWDGVGPPELALLTANHLLVVDLAGDPLEDATQLFTDAPMSMAVIDDAGSARQRIAWVSDGIFFTPWVVLVGEDGTEGPLQLGSFTASAPFAADYDGDGDSELFFGPEAADDAFMVGSASESAGPGTPTYTMDPAPNLRFPLRKASGSYGDRTDRPLVHDFDNDGDPDVLLVDEVLGEVRLVRGEVVDETRLVYSASGGTFVAGCAEEDGTLTISLVPPPDAVPDADELELVVWERADPALGIDPLPIHAESVPLAGLDPLPPVAFVVDVPQAWSDFEALYYLEVRVVSKDPSTGVRRAWPAYPLAFGTSFDGTLSLETDPVLGGELPLVTTPCPPPPPPPGTAPGKAVGGGIAAPLPVIQPFREGDIPEGGG